MGAHSALSNSTVLHKLIDGPGACAPRFRSWFMPYPQVTQRKWSQQPMLCAPCPAQQASAQQLGHVAAGAFPVLLKVLKSSSTAGAAARVLRAIGDAHKGPARHVAELPGTIDALMQALRIPDAAADAVAALASLRRHPNVARHVGRADSALDALMAALGDGGANDKVAQALYHIAYSRRLLARRISETDGALQALAPPPPGLPDPAPIAFSALAAAACTGADVAMREVEAPGTVPALLAAMRSDQCNNRSDRYYERARMSAAQMLASIIKPTWDDDVARPCHDVTRYLVKPERPAHHYGHSPELVPLSEHWK